MSVSSSDRYLPSTQELPSLETCCSCSLLPSIPAQTVWLCSSQSVLQSLWQGVPRELVHSKEDCRDTTASLGATVAPSAENASTVELLYCFKVLSCGFWHAPITGPTTTSCVGGICMVVNFFQILTEGILARTLHAIARRPD